VSSMLSLQLTRTPLSLAPPSYSESEHSILDPRCSANSYLL
jgi:hypothetical protein